MSGSGRSVCASRGYWMNLLKVKKSGVLSRHRHPQPVHGFVLKGEWRYLEHDWVATEGAYVYEAPGETHTLVVDPHVEEMITLFQVNGAMIYVDPDGKTTGYDDVFTRSTNAGPTTRRTDSGRTMSTSSSGERGSRQPAQAASSLRVASPAIFLEAFRNSRATILPSTS